MHTIIYLQSWDAKTNTISNNALVLGYYDLILPYKSHIAFFWKATISVITKLCNSSSLLLWPYFGGFTWNIFTDVDAAKPQFNDDVFGSETTCHVPVDEHGYVIINEQQRLSKDRCGHLQATYTTSWVLSYVVAQVVSSHIVTGIGQRKYWSNAFDQNFSLTQGFAMTRNISLTQILSPLIFCWPKFLQWPRRFDRNVSLTQIFWPKLKDDPLFYHDSKILIQKFWVEGLWPVVFGSAGPKTFSSVIFKNLYLTFIIWKSCVKPIPTTVIPSRLRGTLLLDSKATRSFLSFSCQDNMVRKKM